MKHLRVKLHINSAAPELNVQLVPRTKSRARVGETETLAPDRCKIQQLEILNVTLIDSST